MAPIRAGKQEREQIVDGYLKYLEENDGTLGESGQTFSRREEEMARLRTHTARYQGRMIDDESLLAAYLHNRKLPSDTPEAVLLLLAFLKVNQNEAYGVETLVRLVPEVTPVERRVLTQENYHTQLLLGAADFYGVNLPGRARPPAAVKVLVHTIARFPPWLRAPMALVAELMGIAVFKRLLKATGRVLRDQPEVRDAMEERVMRVLVDEIGHLSYNRLLVGPARMEMVKQMIPFSIFGFRNTFLDELERVSGGPLTTAEIYDLTFDGMPDAALREAFVA